MQVVPCILLWPKPSPVEARGHLRRAAANEGSRSEAMDVLSADALDQMHVNGFAFWFVDIAAALFSRATGCTHELMARLVHHAQPDQCRLRVLDTARESKPA